MKNGGVAPLTFTVELLKRSCLLPSRNIFSGRKFIRGPETSRYICLRAVLLQNLNEKTTIFSI